MEKMISSLLNSYTLKANLFPMFFLLIPLLLVGWLFFPFSITDIQATITPTLFLCGIGFGLAQLGRKRGKRLEPKLWAKWGGMPSMQIFRHSDTTIDSISKANYHNKLAQLVDNTTTPTKEEEAADPVATDRVYWAWSEYLRIHTRGCDFPLVFKELTNYGFLRNLNGLRPLSIICIISGLCVIGLAHSGCFTWFSIKPTPFSILAVLVNLIFLILWVFTVREKWVRSIAFEYAKRLIESTEIVYQKTQSK